MIKDLEFVSPESQGLRSEDVLEFIHFLEYQKINIHSFLMARRGKIIAEGYVPPFHKDFAHRLYSSSKTFVSLAVGLLITEGKITLQDKICDYLQDYIEKEQHPWVRDMTVEDCLTMSQPMFRDMNKPLKDPNRWCYNQLNEFVVKKPAGTIFRYGNGADLMGVVIRQITGMEFLDYLRPVFDEIGVAKDIWCVRAAEGHCWGGSGVVCTLRDFAKVGELVLNKGFVGGKQLIDREYMEKATSAQISNLSANNYRPQRSGGYGYLIWIAPDAAIFSGMGSQMCYCFQKKDFMLVCQADTQGEQTMAASVIYDWAKYLLYDRIGRKKKEGKAYIQLQEKLKNLQPPMYGVPHSDYEKELSGKTYTLAEDNPMGWKYFRFDFAENGKEGKLTYENARGVKEIAFDMGHLRQGTFPETHYYDKKRDEPANRELNSLTACEWLEEKKLLLRIYITDTSFGNCFAVFSFKDDVVGVELNKTAEFFLDDYHGMTYGFLQGGE